MLKTSILTILIICFAIIPIGCSAKRPDNTANKIALIDTISSLQVSTNDRKKRLNSVKVESDWFVFEIDSMLNAPLLSKDSINKIDTVKFVVGITGIDGELFERAVYIKTLTENAVTIQEKVCVELLFDVGESGGLNAVDSIHGQCSEWISLQQISDSIFKTLPEDQDSVAPAIDSSEYAKAERYKHMQKAYTSFEKYITKVLFKITSDKKEKVIEFNIEHGD